MITIEKVFSDYDAGSKTVARHSKKIEAGKVQSGIDYDNGSKTGCHLVDSEREEARSSVESHAISKPKLVIIRARIAHGKD